MFSSMYTVEYVNRIKTYVKAGYPYVEKNGPYLPIALKSF